MREYLDLVQTVIDNGIRKHSRTGIDTLSYFSAFYKVDLSKGFPLLTTKKMIWDSLLHEVLWYLSGDNHIRNLRNHTKIWDAWADKDGNLDTAYGYYWRHFPSAKKNENGDWEVVEIDQIKYIIDEIKRNPNSRRLIVSAWEPGNATTSKLPPCHYTYAFNIANNKVNCHLTQRSGDIALGIPFNLAAYSILTHIIAMETGYEVGEFAHTIIDAHIYIADKGTELERYDHLEGLKLQLKREPYELPRLEINKKPLDQLTFEDFKLINYKHHDRIKFEVAV